MKVSYLILILFLAGYIRAQIQDAANCAACHEEVHEQWQKSMHALSTATNDTLYAAMLNWAIEDTKGKAKKLCAGCHRPFAALTEDKEEQKRPVDCTVCHSIDYSSDPPRVSTSLFSSRENAVSDIHLIKAKEYFKNNQLCLTCHGKLENPSGVQICITALEYDETIAKDRKCISCHMSSEASQSNDETKPDGSHLFPGPHQEGFLKNTLALTTDIFSDSLRVVISNAGTPHAYPTGSPLRMVFLEITGLDLDDEIVYKNFQDIVAIDDPKALFMRIFEDDDGNIPVPPWKAKKVRSDNRLKAGEVRVLTYSIPRMAKKLVVELKYRLAPLVILDRLEIDDPFLTSEHLIVKNEVEIEDL